MTVDATATIDLLDRWAHALGIARSTRAEDIAAALGLDFGSARRLGRQWDFPPSDGLAAVVLVLAADTPNVVSAQVWPDPSLPLDQFSQRFGPGRPGLGAIHDAVPSFGFADVVSAGAARSCAVLVRPTAGWPDEHRVRCVTLHLI
jgi:hypothetical protein